MRKTHKVILRVGKIKYFCVILVRKLTYRILNSNNFTMTGKSFVVEANLQRPLESLQPLPLSKQFLNFNIRVVVGECLFQYMQELNLTLSMLYGKVKLSKLLWNVCAYRWTSFLLLCPCRLTSRQFLRYRFKKKI